MCCRKPSTAPESGASAYTYKITWGTNNQNEETPLSSIRFYDDDDNVIQMESITFENIGWCGNGCTWSNCTNCETASSCTSATCGHTGCTPFPGSAIYTVVSPIEPKSLGMWFSGQHDSPNSIEFTVTRSDNSGESWTTSSFAEWGSTTIHFYQSACGEKTFDFN